MSESNLPEWEEVLSAAAHLQQILPDATLVGGTAVAIFANHRVSRDADHVLTDLRARFDDVLAQLEAVAGIETGVRQMVRERPLETQQVDVAGRRLIVPTDEELLRIKGVLILTRNATRDPSRLPSLNTGLFTRAVRHPVNRVSEPSPEVARLEQRQRNLCQRCDRAFSAFVNALETFASTTGCWLIRRAVSRLPLATI